MHVAPDSNPLDQYLSTGERILWSGQPAQGLLLRRRDALLIPFSLVWGGFAIVWNAAVWLMPAGGDIEGNNPGWFARIWGLPFLAVGLYILAGRFFHDARLRRSTFYAVTDRRILILRGRNLTSLDVNRLPRLELSEHRDGTGTLTFEADYDGPWSGRGGFSGFTPALSGAARFARIREPRKVFDMVRHQADP